MGGISNEELIENRMVHCTSPIGSMDGSIIVESESGELSDLTTIQVSKCKQNIIFQFVVIC